jgi:hypothetical protein
MLSGFILRFILRMRDSKAAGREKFGKLFYLPRPGREYFVFCEYLEQKT